MKSRGLTLIEMVVVVAILALLLIISMGVWRNQIDKANDAKRKDDLQRISLAFEEYLSDHDCYPAVSILENCGGEELKPYLTSIPCDPVYKTPYCYLPEGANPACADTFRLLAPLENETDPGISKLGCDGDEYCGYETQCADPSRLIGGYNYGVSSNNVTVLNPAVTPAPSANPSIAPSAPASPHPGGDTYIYACDRQGLCNSWDHYPNGCYFFEASNCNNLCSNPVYWCSE
jgi:prepilin-type N-terminal cleavage/methylation domain-containing protein